MHLPLLPRSMWTRRPGTTPLGVGGGRNTCTVRFKARTAPPASAVQVALTSHIDVCVSLYLQTLILVSQSFYRFVCWSSHMQKTFSRTTTASSASRYATRCHRWCHRAPQSEQISSRCLVSQAAVIDLMQRRRLPPDAVDRIKPLLDTKVMCAG